MSFAILLFQVGLADVAQGVR